MPNLVRQTREHQARQAAEQQATRFARERRLQALGLLLLAAAVLAGTVLHAGVRNVFLPGWWRPW